MRLVRVAMVTWAGLFLLSCATGDSYQKAVRLDQAGQHEKAAFEFTKAIAWDPDRAISDLNEALRLDPDYYLAYYTRGTVYLLREDLERAKRDFDRCLELNDQFARAYNNRGVVQAVLGDSEQACGDWRKACDLGFDPGCETARESC